MRWISWIRKAPHPEQEARPKCGTPTRALPVREASRLRMLLEVTALLLACTLFLSGAPEKHLSVYSVAANYSLPLVQREGHDYVGLLELLEPLGKVSAKADGSRWRLRYNNVQAEFEVNKARARVQGRDAELGGKFVMENKRGFVPLGSLSALLPRILGGPVSLHEVPIDSLLEMSPRISRHRWRATILRVSF